MLRKVSDFVRRCAYTMTDTGPRVAERNKTNIEGDPITEPAPVEVTVSGPVEPEEGSNRGPGAPMKPGTPEEAPKPTSGPTQRAPRRQPAHAREWSPDNRRQKMREYMQQYRGTGKVNERKMQSRGA